MLRLDHVRDQLSKVDWSFADYSGAKSRGELNGLHWYPASFVPQIPAFLIKALSKQQDMVVDPFGGSGTTAMEAIRLNRRWGSYDINPVAVSITQSKVDLLGLPNDWSAQFLLELQKLLPHPDPSGYLASNGLDVEIPGWFHKSTLAQLCSLHEWATRRDEPRADNLRRVLLSAILNRASSQDRLHSYITDGCQPKSLIPRDAFLLLRQQIEAAEFARKRFLQQVHESHGPDWQIPKGEVRIQDARKMALLDANGVDLIVTSPPYLGVLDYTKSMRLTRIFGLIPGIGEAFDSELGARRKRNRKNVREEFVSGLVSSADEMVRTVKPGGFVALVTGQGGGRAVGEDTIQPMLERLTAQGRTVQIFDAKRSVSFRRIPTAGVRSERILVFQRE